MPGTEPGSETWSLLSYLLKVSTLSPRVRLTGRCRKPLPSDCPQPSALPSCNLSPSSFRSFLFTCPFHVLGPRLLGNMGFVYFCAHCATQHRNPEWWVEPVLLCKWVGVGRCNGGVPLLPPALRSAVWTRRGRQRPYPVSLPLYSLAHSRPSVNIY